MVWYDTYLSAAFIRLSGNGWRDLAVGGGRGV